jgi:M6 family metalloprotease-like protein
MLTFTNASQDKDEYIAIPELDPKGDVQLSLGPIDKRIQERSTGHFTSALVFINFPGIVNEKTPQVVARELTAGDKAANWFKKQSFGRMSMEFVTPVAEWRTMSKQPCEYHSRTSEAHRDLIQEALNLFPETNFTKYDYVIVVPANQQDFKMGTACYSEYLDYKDGIQTKHGSINLGVSMGTSHFTPLSYYTLIHELGHCLSLPDTYDTSIRDLSHRAVAGAWDLMCDVGSGVNFLGFHRQHLGWIPDDRKHYMKNETVLEAILTPYSESEGLSMIAIPLNDTENPSKVFVIELALPIREAGKELHDGQNYGEGILVYSVDATLGSGRRPLVVYPKSTKYSEIYSYTYEAPFLVGDNFEHNDAPMKVEVLSKKTTHYKIRIIKK